MPEQINPEQAREYLSTYGHAPDSLKSLPDPDVLALHGSVMKARQKELDEHVKSHDSKWRERLAGDDKDAMQTLGRLTDQGQLWKSYNELRTKMAKGELKQQTPFPEKGTTEEQVAWRKDRGIPEKPEAYDTTLENGVVIGEDDKPMVNSFLKFAHSKNIPQPEAKGMLQWYFGEFLANEQKAISEQKSQREQETKAALQESWGGDYKRHMVAVDNLIAKYVQKDGDKSDLAKRIKNAVAQDAGFTQLLASLAYEIDPATSISGITGTDSMKGIETRLAEIDKFMRTNRAAYNKDEKMQAEYRDLLAAKQKLEERGKATA